VPGSIEAGISVVVYPNSKFDSRRDGLQLLKLHAKPQAVWGICSAYSPIAREAGKIIPCPRRAANKAIQGIAFSWLQVELRLRAIWLFPAAFVKHANTHEQQGTCGTGLRYLPGAWGLGGGRVDSCSFAGAAGTVETVAVDALVADAKVIQGKLADRTAESQGRCKRARLRVASRGVVVNAARGASLTGVAVGEAHVHIAELIGERAARVVDEKPYGAGVARARGVADSLESQPGAEAGAVEIPNVEAQGRSAGQQGGAGRVGQGDFKRRLGFGATSVCASNGREPQKLKGGLRGQSTHVLRGDVAVKVDCEGLVQIVVGNAHAAAAVQEGERGS